MTISQGVAVRRIAGAAAALGLCVTGVVTVPTAQAAGSVKAAINLIGPSSGTYNTTARLSGTAWRYGTSTKIAGATVILQRTPHGGTTWSNLTSAKTTSTGTFAFGVTLTGAYDYRAYYAGSTTYTTAVSGKVYPAVKRAVAFDSIKTTDDGYEASNRIGTLKASGRAYPLLPKGTPVYLQRYDAAAKTWKTIGSSTASGSSAAIAVSAKVRGSVAPYRLHVPLKYPYAAGTSRAVTFAHYVWRGVFWKPIYGSGGMYNPGYRIDPYSREDPYRSSAALGADRGGTSWIDVNTVGCLEMDFKAVNYTDEYTPTRERIGFLYNGTYERYADLNAGGSQWLPTAYIGGRTKFRFQVTDLGKTGDPLAFVVAWVRCNN